MKQARMFLFVAGVVFVAATASGQTQPTIASAVDSEINLVEKELVEAAEAMPDDKFNFSPESLKIPGADFKGVRPFSWEIIHVAYSSYVLWSPLTGDKIPERYSEKGIEKLKTKGDIIQFLKDSFALGHKAAASLTPENIAQRPEGSKSTRLYLATFGAAHALDHYGQMVEYLRMNGIVPPASRP